MVGAFLPIFPTSCTLNGGHVATSGQWTVTGWHPLWAGQQELLRSAISIFRGQESDNVTATFLVEKAHGGKWHQPPSGLGQETHTHHGP